MKRPLAPVYLLFASLVSFQSLFAAPPPLSFEHELSVSDFKGKPYLEALIEEDIGIKANFDEDYLQEYTVASWTKVNKALKNFDKKIVDRVMQAFGKDKQAFREFSEKIAGEVFTPASSVGLIRANYKGKGNIFVLAHFYAMASGAGTMISIDDENYFYNFGYKSGEEADDVKSGRSYGAGPDHNANDASDVMYLNELEAYLTSDESAEEYFETLLELLTQTDASGFANLSESGQTTATDFLAIYTAELDRHVMVNLNPVKHPWENDLAEATFVSAYSAVSGMLMKDGELQEAPLRDFWALSSFSNRSGIGIGRKDRRAMQRAISSYMREHHKDLVAAVDKVTGGKRRDGDVFRGLMEYLNNFKTQKKVDADAKKITKAFVAFLMQVQEDADSITSYISH